MKVHESGMPSEEIWKEFFDVGAILEKLGLTSACWDVVEFRLS